MAAKRFWKQICLVVQSWRNNETETFYFALQHNNASGGSSNSEHAILSTFAKRFHGMFAVYSHDQAQSEYHQSNSQGVLLSSHKESKNDPKSITHGSCTGCPALGWIMRERLFSSNYHCATHDGDNRTPATLGKYLPAVSQE